MLACLLAQILNFKKFITSQKFQSGNMFQDILNNFDFFTMPPPPCKNEITPDLASYMFQPPPQIFLSKFFFSHQISKIFKPKCVSGYSEQMTFSSKKKTLDKIFWIKVVFYQTLKILQLNVFQILNKNSKKFKTKICFRRF